MRFVHLLLMLAVHLSLVILMITLYYIQQEIFQLGELTKLAYKATISLDWLDASVRFDDFFEMSVDASDLIV
jgi:hypothetical protein